MELNKTATLVITLEVSATATSIEVVGGVTPLDTTTSQVASMFEDASTLPSATSGSGVLNLSLLSAGVGTSGGVGAVRDHRWEDNGRAIRTLRSKE